MNIADWADAEARKSVDERLADARDITPDYLLAFTDEAVVKIFGINCFLHGMQTGLKLAQEQIGRATP